MFITNSIILLITASHIIPEQDNIDCVGCYWNHGRHTGNWTDLCKWGFRNKWSHILNNYLDFAEYQKQSSNGWRGGGLLWHIIAPLPLCFHLCRSWLPTFLWHHPSFLGAQERMACHILYNIGGGRCGSIDHFSHRIASQGILRIMIPITQVGIKLTVWGMVEFHSVYSTGMD